MLEYLGKMKKIIIYTTETCSYCHMVKEFLKEKKIDFEEIDVEENQDKAKEMVEKSGQMGVPVTDVDGEIIIGFDEPKIEDILKKKGFLK